MRKFLAIIAMMVTMLCGSIMLVSCSNDYKKMSLVVEYALPSGNGEVEWHTVDLEKGFDYTISEGVSSLYMRVKVEGTSKKVDSLYISQSVNSATFLQNSSVAPNEIFEVKVKNTGSVRFLVTPSQGGSDKSVSFGVNVYKQIEGISQNPTCIPALVNGGYIELDKLTDLIKYEPFGKTNQTGVNFVIADVGTLSRDGDTNLLNRDFSTAGYIKTEQEDLSENVVSEFKKNGNRVALEKIDNKLVLTNRSTAGYASYALTNENNVIKLTASSIWNEKIDEEISCDVYVYMVENIKDALLVSYNDNKNNGGVELEDGDAESVFDSEGNVKQGDTTANIKARMEVEDTITLYNSSVDVGVVDQDFSAVRLYTYMNPSIYSYESNPGFKLNVYVNDKKYDYNAMPDNSLGIQISSIIEYDAKMQGNKLVGLKFAVNPNSIATATSYKVKMEVDFNAFDFGASDKNPETYLNKEFVINIQTLASGFNINGRGYQDNLSSLAQGEVVPNIIELDSAEIAKLFTSYVGGNGMPLTLQATPTNAQNSTVYMGVYDGYKIDGGKLSVANNTNYVEGGVVQLRDRFGFDVTAKDIGLGSQFKIDAETQRSKMYLRFNPSAKIPNKDELYIICNVVCTPTEFRQESVNTKYITFVSKVKVVGAIDDINIYKDEGKNHTFTDGELVQYNIQKHAYIDFSTSTLYGVDLSEIKITSKNKNIKFLTSSNEWLTEITADQFGVANSVFKKLTFKSEIQCKDTIQIVSTNGKSVDLALEFVSVTSPNLVTVDYDREYVWTYSDDSEEDVEYNTNDVELKYLAIQLGRNVQFRAYGNNNMNNIQSVTAKSLLLTSKECDSITKNGESIYKNKGSKFNSSAVIVTNLIQNNMFDVYANNDGFTSVVLVKVDFYAEEAGGSIAMQTKYFVFEIATYVPARDILVTEENSKESIIYINENYSDVALLELNVELLKDATSQIEFSSSSVNDVVNKKYGEENAKSIYGIQADVSKLNSDYFANTGLLIYEENGAQYNFVNLKNPLVTIVAKKDLTDIPPQVITFKIWQFGVEKDVTEIKYIINIGSYNPTSEIVIESGVQLYNNVYLNLLNGSDSAEIVAYATNEEGNATYSGLGFKVNKFNGEEYKEYTGANLVVLYDNTKNKFSLIADKEEGGVYELVIYAMDSQVNPDTNEPIVAKRIKVTVSDGKTDATAYLLRDIKDFVSLASENNPEKTKDKFYRLSTDIDFDKNHITSTEIELLDNWWKANRTFMGTLDGQMVIENLNKNTKIIRNYAIKNLTVSNNVDGVTDKAGLFNSVTASATIKNVIFENAKIQVEQLTQNDAYIGIITAINHGTISNCSVTISASKVNVKNTPTANGNTNIKTVNVGLVAGENNGIITYQASATNSNYSHIVGVTSGSVLAVDVNANVDSANSENSAIINIGGIAGINNNLVNADYQDGADMSISELINAVVNINVENYSTSSTINLAGLVGNNATSGTIRNITVTGLIEASGKSNVGSIAGTNAGTVTEVVNFGADIIGHTNAQNIGGIIGENSATNVDNVRVVFIAFDNTEIPVNSGSATIQGTGAQSNVGGIIGKTASTQLTRAYVENFILDKNNIIGAEDATVAGLVASGSADATLCFVQANISADSDKFDNFGTSVTPTYSYINGKINNVSITEYYEEDENKVDIDDIGAVRIEDIDDEIDNSTFVGYPAGAPQFYINWLQNDNVNDGYPYLVYKLNQNDEYYINTLTISPQEIIVNVDKQYFDIETISDKFIKLATEPDDWDTNWKKYYIKNNPDEYVQLTNDSEAPSFTSGEYYKKDISYFGVEDDGLYMQYEDGDDIVATAIVYYDETKSNTHKLVSDKNGEKGLIEKTIIPSIANGNYSVSIVEGGSIATLTSGDNTIEFSGTGRVVLRFVSIYDRNISDTVVIFVEKPLASDVFEITTSSGLKLVNENTQNYSTRAQMASLLGINLKGVAEKTFDNTKTYMTATVTEIVDSNSNDVTGKFEDYLTVLGKTAEIEQNSGKYLLGQFELSTGELHSTISYVKATIQLNVYLDLSKYKDKNDTALNQLISADALLETRTILVTIFNKATDLTVPSNSNIKAESSVAVDISANLVTGYVEGCEESTPISKYDKDKIYSGNEEYYQITGETAQRLILRTPKHDKLEYELSAINSNAQKLVEKQQDLNPLFSVWDLFDIIITHEQIESVGYKYNLNLRLKDEFKYLDLNNQVDKEWRFNVKISANEGDLVKNVQFAYVPQQLNSLRIENYSNLVARNTPAGATEMIESEFVSNESESSLIIPGESGLIKIFAEYDYSYFDDIKITSSTQVIDGKTYFVKFQQMVYNKDTKRYQSLAGVTADGTTLALRKISYADGKYDGTLFVRTILEKFAGERKSFTITVDATTYDINMNEVLVSRDKTVVSKYRPGVYINVTNALEGVYDVTVDGKTEKQSVYLVENGTQSTIIEAKVYGYEYNVQPIVTVKDLNGDEITDGTIAVIRQGDVQTDASSGATVIRYSLFVNSTQAFNIEFEVRLIDNGVELKGDDKTITFFPVPFIPKSVTLDGVANGDLIVPVNTSKEIKLQWATTSEAISETKQKLIDEALDGVDILRMFHINSGNDKKYFSDFVKTNTAADNDKSFLISGKDNKYIIESKKKEDTAFNVTLDLWYYYDFEVDAEGNLTKVEVKFSTERSTYLLPYNFDLILTLQTSEDAPTPVYDVRGLMALRDGEDGILMNDIIINLDNNTDKEGVSLGPWQPLSANIASLDGNGKKITFTGNTLNVAVQESTSTINTGLLFASVGQDTILKNIVINIGGLETNTLYIKDDNIENATINFGILAGQNDGLIYNCEIISTSADAITGAKAFELIVGAKYGLTFGGLVGVNNGNITNSRVGTEYFEEIANNGSSTRISCYPIKIRTTGVVAGLVGVNSSKAVISSSFVANTSIENRSNIGDSSKTRTAGFVATNNGTIAYSYVKGIERTILETRLRATGASVYASGAGSVAGFAYYNGGTIHDCYSNIECKSISSAVAGFVYDTSSGAVYQCYSASKVESEVQTTLATELPFIGVGIDKDNAQQLLSSENVLNCYYLKGETEYDKNYLVDENDNLPKELSAQGFQTRSNLNNFAFIDQGSIDQELNGVWTNSTAIDKNRTTYALSTTILPELTSANHIARSVRTLISKVGEGEDASKNEYAYVTNYDQGSKNNPYIIRSVEEYQNVFVNGEKVGMLEDVDKKYLVANVRFIDNIDFAVNIGEGTQYVDIDTRHNYVLGDTGNSVLTTIDGNGMTISNIVINYSKEEHGALGLFSEMQYAVIKGLNLSYTNMSGVNIGSSTAIYAGGVAGTAHNVYMIDLNLTGSNIELHARNIAGGVVGKLTGERSGLYNIYSNISAKSGKEISDLYYKEQTNPEDESVIDTRLSYAGGIAGIIDSNEAERYLNKLTVDGATITAARAGGIAGYIGKNIDAQRLTYYITTSSQITGTEVVGGLIAENYADIKLSQVNSENLDTQYGYDKHFGEYINSEDVKVVENGVEVSKPKAIDNTDTAYGNLSAVTGAGIIGGFIGENHGGNINDSLTKANISHNSKQITYDWDQYTTIGGFTGVTYGGNVKNVYAQNYIELNYVEGDNTKFAGVVGGLIGKASKKVESESHFGINDSVALNFFDKTQVEKLPGKDANTTYSAVSYVVGQLDGAVACSTTESKSVKPVVNYGVFNKNVDNEDEYKDGKITKGDISVAQSVDMESLYRDGSSTQRDIFNILFASWNNLIWEKIYNRYTPNLVLDSASDYYVIENQDDLKFMDVFPDANFILKNDVPVDASRLGNYVVDTDFTGTLFGTRLPEENRYTKFIIRGLSPSLENDTGAGFFRLTDGARIGNIGFEYQTVTLTKGANNETVSTYNEFGGVSATDYDSRFEQIAVTYDPTGHNYTTIISEDETSIKSVGSIVGNSERSEILSCTSNLGYDISAEDGAYIGGLVGTINGIDNSREDFTGKQRVAGLISSSSYTGSMTINGASAHVGGIVGKTYYTHVSNSSVKGVLNRGYETPIDIKVKADDSGANNFIGGIVAENVYSTVTECDAYIKVTTEGEIAGTQTIGGIIAKAISGVDDEPIINNSYAKLVINKMNTTTAIIGGIIGSSTGSAIILDAVASEMTIEGDELEFGYLTLGGIVGENVLGDVEIQNAVAIMYVSPKYNTQLIGGGIIGQTSEGYSLTNIASMGYIHANCTVGDTNPSFPSLTILGGTVGLAGTVEDRVVVDSDSPKGTIKDSYAVLTLSTAGVYRGDYNNDPEDATNVTKHDVHTGGIVGYAKGKNVIKIEGNVLYSSDYTLALEEHNVFNTQSINVTEEEHNVFNTQPINVTANVLITEDTGNYFNDWTRALTLRSEKNTLPMPPDTSNLLEGLGIWTIEVDEQGNADPKYTKDTDVGKPYYPIIINSNDDVQFDDYKYYSLNHEITTFTHNYDTLNGVLMGNNATLVNNRSVFNKVALHSAVTNLNIQLQNNGTGANARYGSDAGVVTTNNGTVFMVGVNYEDIIVPIEFAGIVSTNNGVVSNCYNNGIANLPSAASANQLAGLVATNKKNAVIIDSYFTGIFKYAQGGVNRTGNEADEADDIPNVTNYGSGIAGTNTGYIGNTYTAGQTDVIINTFVNGRYSNVYYDYYATFVYSGKGDENNPGEPAYYEDLKAEGIEGLETIEVQKVNGSGTETDPKSTSTLFSQSYTDNNLTNNWKVYSMHNWDDIYTKMVNGEKTPEVDTTYNYGYPIKKIAQQWYNGGIADVPSIRGKNTGNGTFKEISSKCQIYDTIYQAALGKVVVYDSDFADGQNNQVDIIFDSNPFLISNLGVMSLINEIKSLTGEDGDKISGTKGKYFELENDITMFRPAEAEKLQQTDDEKRIRILTDGPKIGTPANAFEGVFTSAPSQADLKEWPSANGTVVKAYCVDHYLYTDKPGSAEGLADDIRGDNGKLLISMDDEKTISNLYGTALFANVGDGAIIANIQLTGTHTKDAPLISNAGYESSQAEKSATITIYNINIGAITACNSAGQKAGFVHNVLQTATLNICNTKCNVTFTTNTETATTSGVVGTNEGTINIDNTSFKMLKIEFKNVAKSADGNGNVAGFVGKNAETGSINANAVNLTLTVTPSSGTTEVGDISGFASENSGMIYGASADSFKVTIEIKEALTAKNIAGLIGDMKYGGSIYNATVNYKIEGEVEVTNFGGAVTTLNGGTVGPNSSATVGSNDSTIQDSIKIVGPIKVKAQKFGGVVTIANDGSIKSVNVDAGSDKEFEIVGPIGNNDANNAYGLIIGEYNTALAEIDYTTVKDSSLIAYDCFNVGGVIGHAKSGVFKFTNSKPELVVAQGAGNVGGFIGLFDGKESLDSKDEQSLEFKDKSWPIDNSGYADVGIAVKNASSEEFSNFGGLIGYWNSASAINKNHEISNGNRVLAEEGLFAVPNATAFKIKDITADNYNPDIPDSNLTIENIGGVAGRYDYGNPSSANCISNSASIGIELTFINNSNANPIIGDKDVGLLYKMYQLENVGGLFGVVVLKEDVQQNQTANTNTSQNEFDQDCENGDAIIITLTNASNKGNVCGMTAVGGLIGRADIKVKIQNTKAVTEQTKSDKLVEAQTTGTDIISIAGVFDVGGLVGYANSTVDISGTIASSESGTINKTYVIYNLNVVGIINVGGLVGWAEDLHVQYVQIGNTDATVTVKGNAYVGGLVGYVDLVQLDNITITPQTTVIGTIFGHKYKHNTELRKVAYLPTNVGGVAGYINRTHVKKESENTSGGESITTYTCIGISKVKTSAKVCTEENYNIDGKNSVQVNMNTNYYINVAGEKRTLYGDTKGNGYFFIHTLIKYDTIDGGIGGFAGGINAQQLEYTDTKGIKKSIPYTYLGPVGSDSDNEILGEVYAPFGINVGGVIGYVSGNLSNIKLPKMGNANVCGKVFVGAFVGQCDGSVDGSEDGFKVPEGTVNVQKSSDAKVISGYCVGGVVGYVTGEVKGISLTKEHDINVFNEGSIHVGALVGRLDRSMENCSIAPELCGAKQGIVENAYLQYYADYGNINGIIQKPTEYNYGGLVGLLNVTTNKVIVQGDHYYAFTVDVVQNYKMENGLSKYAYEEDYSGYDVLSAMAHYINSAQLKISISALNDLYDGYFTKGATSTNITDFDHNPTRSDARGWASEYTMFRMMSRAIKQGDFETGDSVQEIYSANNIKEVGVGKYTEPVNTGIVKKEAVGDNPAEYYQFRREDNITYTVYQPAGQGAFLYCMYGIASEYTRDKDDRTVSTTIEYKKISDEEESGWPYPDISQGYYKKAVTLEISDKEITTVADLATIRKHLTPLTSQIETIGDSGALNGGIDDKWSLETARAMIELRSYVALGLYTTASSAKEVIGIGTVDDDDNYTYGNKLSGVYQDLTFGYDYVDTAKLWGTTHVPYNTDEHKYFNFTVVFDNNHYINPTITVIPRITVEAQGNDYRHIVSASPGDQSESHLSGSGSLFDVYGSMSQPNVKFSIAEEVKTPIPTWKKIVAWVFVGLTGGIAAISLAVSQLMIKGICALIALCIPTISIPKGSGMFDYSTVAADRKMIGLETTYDSFNNLFSSSDVNGSGVEYVYGALQTVYTKQITISNGKSVAENDDIINVTVACICNDTEHTCKKEYELAYIACGPVYTMPNDYGSTVTFTDTDKVTHTVPKYYVSGSELYMYPDLESFGSKRLVGFKAQEPFGGSEKVNFLIDNNLYYVTNNNVSSVVKDDVATYVENTYNVRTTLDRTYKCTLKTGVASAPKNVYYKSLTNLYWKQTSTANNGKFEDGYKSISYYTTTKPNSGFYAEVSASSVGLEGDNNVYLVESGGNELPNNHTVYYACHNNGVFYTEDDQNVIKQTGAFYILENGGNINAKVKYYLYYPKVNNVNYTWGIVTSANLTDENNNTVSIATLAQCPDISHTRDINDNVTSTTFSTKDGTTSYTLPGYYKVEDNKLQVYKAVNNYKYDTALESEGFKFVYQVVPNVVANNYNIVDYNKYVYRYDMDSSKTTDDINLYTRYYYGVSENDFFGITPEGSKKKIYELLTGGDNLILSEGVRVTINTGSDKIIKANPSYVSTQEQKGN